MKKRILSVALLVSAWGGYSQVGIGTLTPDKSSQLDVTANNKGILIPRVSLTSTTDITTITNGNVNSLLVFNTATQNDITPGYYYWYIDKWKRMVNDDEVGGNVYYDGDTFTYVDANGETQIVNVKKLVQDNESQTVIITVDDQQYYISEAYLSENDGVVPTTVDPTAIPDGIYLIDVIGGVTNNIEQILGDTNVLNELIEVLGDTYVGGNVYYDGTQFTYVDQSGTTHTINFEEIVQASETVTQLVKNTDGTYTYYNETQIDEDGDPVGTGVTIDVAKGATASANATLGLVKEADVNPTVAVSQTGELSVNLENLNAIKVVEADYAALDTDNIILGKADNIASVTITLPAATADNKGKKYTIKKEDASEDGYVNVVGTIVGVPSGELYTAVPYTGWDLVSDGAAWRIVNKF